MKRFEATHHYLERQEPVSSKIDNSSYHRLPLYATQSIAHDKVRLCLMLASFSLIDGKVGATRNFAFSLPLRINPTLPMTNVDESTVYNESSENSAGIKHQYGYRCHIKYCFRPVRASFLVSSSIN